MKIAILGAGISGLSLAWFLKKRFRNQVEITLYEKQGRIGGMIQTVHEQGFLFELGPRGISPHGKGLMTLALVEELGLKENLLSASAAAVARYIWLEGKLQRLSLAFLLQRGLLGALARDCLLSQRPREEETIAEYAARSLGKKLAEDLIDPAVRGIFGTEAATLSLYSCFPSLFQLKQKRGYLVSGLTTLRRRKKESVWAGFSSPLYTFKQGMALLPERLAERLEVDLLLNYPIETQAQLAALDADLIFSTLPLSHLSALFLREPLFHSTPLTLVHMAWHTSILPQRGYGFLLPSHENSQLLGMTWDSEIFPEINPSHAPKASRLCLLFQGNHAEIAYQEACQSVERYLSIRTPPDHYKITFIKEAIPHYDVHFKHRMATLQAELPQQIHLVGAAIGVNESIFKAHESVRTLCLPLSSIFATQAKAPL